MDNEPTVKKSLKDGELYRLRMLALSEDSFLDFVCDLFLFVLCYGYATRRSFSITTLIVYLLARGIHYCV